MSTKIKNRYTGAVMFESANPSIGEAVKEWIADQKAKGAYRADLRDADLRDADLRDADLSDAYGVPGQADPPEPYQRRVAAESDAERIARYRKRYPDAPVIENLDRKILDRIDGGGGLNMATWHTCETTHCRAGWAVALAGEAGYALESKVGPYRAGVRIYRVSTGRVPNFFTTNERALEDIKACAAMAEVIVAGQE